MWNNKTIQQISFALSMIVQLGLSILIPILICIWGAGWLQKTYGFGQWIVITGILLGTGAGISSMVRFIRMISKKIGEDIGDSEEE